MKMQLETFVALAAAILLPGTSAFAQEFSCDSVAIKEKPRWVSGAAVSQDGFQLIVVDPVLNKLFAYNSAGQRLSISDPKLQASEDFEPTSIARLGSGAYLLEEGDSGLVRLSKELKPQSQFFPRGKGKNDSRIGSFYQWTPAGSFLVAYGSLISGGKIGQGFFRVPNQSTGAPEMLTPLQESDYYVIGYPYIAAIGDTAYYLAMGETPALYQAGPAGNAKKMTSFPDSLRTRPKFTTPFTGPKTAAAHFAEFETFTVAAGLYADDRFLYILSRRPATKGRTEWFLDLIDPKSDRLLKQMRLPTTANHLTVAPSDKTWFILERGPVGANQSQDTTSMMMIPSQAIKAGQLPSSCRTR